jgi:hypothetical protein
LATPNVSFAVLSSRSPPPWSVEEFAVAPKVNFVIGVTSQTAKFRE